jgi:bacterioferritin-associated ferredoxin
MYICVCKAVSDRAVRQAAHSGATSLADLRQRLELGTCCGKCACAARELLAEVRTGASAPGEGRA